MDTSLFNDFVARADCKKAYSPLGSELAIKTLSDYSVEYHFTEIVPYIQNRERQK